MPNLNRVFLARHDNINRVLFSVQERPSGDLIVFLKQGTRDAPISFRRPQATVEENRFTIHTSADSKTQINTLKRTYRLGDGTRINNYNLTKAIKIFNRFAPLFVARTNDGEHDTYIPRPKDEIAIIADYQVNSFMLGDHQFNVFTSDFSMFRLTILSTYLAAPADMTSSLFTFDTMPPEEIEAMSDRRAADLLRRRADGVDERGAADLIMGLSANLRDDYFVRLRNDHPDSSEAEYVNRKIMGSVFLEPLA